MTVELANGIYETIPLVSYIASILNFLFLNVSLNSPISA